MRYTHDPPSTFLPAPLLRLALTRYAIKIWDEHEVHHWCLLSLSYCHTQTRNTTRNLPRTICWCLCSPVGQYGMCLPRHLAVCSEDVEKVLVTTHFVLLMCKLTGKRNKWISKKIMYHKTIVIRWLTYAYRCIGSHTSNWYCDQLRETDVSKCVWHQRWHFWDRTLPVPTLLTHIHSVQSHTLPTPTLLTFMYIVHSGLLVSSVSGQDSCLWHDHETRY
jgi:hypothetical protein